MSCDRDNRCMGRVVGLVASLGTGERMVVSLSGIVLTGQDGCGDAGVAFFWLWVLWGVLLQR